MMANDVILPTELVTESDVEQTIIYPLLSGGNYLAINERHIRTKEYLAPTKLDKAAERTTGYFPDYSIWEKAFPLMIVEAKRPSVTVEVGYQEAARYAQHLNQKYRTGVNPCRFVMACNGLRVLFGYWDAAPIFDEETENLVIGSQALERLKSLCGQAVLAAHALECLSRVKVLRASRPYFLAGGQALLNSKRPLNTFAAELSPILRRYFSSSADNRNPEIYGQAYVATAEVTEYDRVLESLMKDRISSRLNPLSLEIEPTRHSEPRLTKAISEFETARPREGQLQLITGRVGAGKSLFIRRYKELLQPDDQRAKRQWVFIDFNTGPADLRTAQAWLCETFLRSFGEENPSFDIYSADALEQIFAVELNRQKGIYEGLAKISIETAALRRMEDLAAWKDDAQKLAFGISRYFGGIKREIVAVVMDNVDRRNLNDQLDAFQLALWFMKESRAFVILQLRDETYERFKNQPPLDTFRTGIGFHISPPRFIHVVKRRPDLSLDFLVAQTEDRLEYTLPNGMRLSYPNTRVGEFLKVLYIDIFHNKKNISRVLQGLASADVRKALDMFVAILTSGHLSEAAITSQTQGAGSIAIPEYTVLKIILMRTEYRFFSEDSGFVQNIFSVDQEWENPNNFLLIEILFFLTCR
jgi:Type I restriction enzyme R protein N terminus (HSDR_N)